MDILYKILLLWVILLFFYFIGVNRTLHGRLEIRILSCRIHLISHSFVTQTREISFYNNRAKSRNLIGSQPLPIGLVSVTSHSPASHFRVQIGGAKARKVCGVFIAIYRMKMSWLLVNDA